MKKFIIVLAVLLIFFSFTTFGQSKQFGIGFYLGQPTGLSMKYFFTSKSASALDFGIAMGYNDGFGQFDSLYFHFDYLYHFFKLFRISGGQLAPYMGIGLAINTGISADYAEVGIHGRFPIGLTFLFSRAPIDLFVEVVPSLDLIPTTSFSYNFGLGLRFYL